MTTVYHADRPDYKGQFPLQPVEAVMTAYAQSLNDYDHWGYDERYRHLLFLTPADGWVHCGPYMAQLKKS